MVFRSAIDWWLGAILALLPVSQLAMALYSASAGDWPAFWISVGALAFVLALFATLVLPMRYELRDEALLVRHGLIRMSIPYGDIRSVRPRTWLLASPALSLKRLHVDHGRPYQTYISPSDRDGFLTALHERIPKLERDGDELVRQDDAG